MKRDVYPWNKKHMLSSRMAELRQKETYISQRDPQRDSCNIQKETRVIYKKRHIPLKRKAHALITNGWVTAKESHLQQEKKSNQKRPTKKMPDPRLFIAFARAPHAAMSKETHIKRKEIYANQWRPTKETHFGSCATGDHGPWCGFVRDQCQSIRKETYIIQKSPTK